MGIVQQRPDSEDVSHHRTSDVSILTKYYRCKDKAPVPKHASQRSCSVRLDSEYYRRCAMIVRIQKRCYWCCARSVRIQKRCHKRHPLSYEISGNASLCMHICRGGIATTGVGRNHVWKVDCV